MVQQQDNGITRIEEHPLRRLARACCVADAALEVPILRALAEVSVRQVGNLAILCLTPNEGIVLTSARERRSDLKGKQSFHTRGPGDTAAAHVHPDRYDSKRLPLAASCNPLIFLRESGGRTRTRTLDPLIKSQLLYQLSYAPTAPLSGEAG